MTTTTTAGSPTGSPTRSAVSLRAPARARGRVGRAIRIALHATSRGGQRLRYSAIGLPAGLRIAGGSGVVHGVPRRSGRFTATVRAVDGAGNAISVVIHWRIAGR